VILKKLNILIIFKFYNVLIKYIFKKIKNNYMRSLKKQFLFI